jgi:hypothetical protein
MSDLVEKIFGKHDIRLCTAGHETETPSETVEHGTDIPCGVILEKDFIKNEETRWTTAADKS